MPFLLLGIFLLLLLLVLGRGLSKADPAKLGPLLGWFLVGLAAAGVGAIILLLAASDRLAPALALAAAVVPVLLRSRRWWGRWRAAATPVGGQSSAVETDLLRMNLDHDTGNMDGTVRCGAFAGRALADLSPEELLTLWRQCRAEDEDSARILESYLDRRLPDWRRMAKPAQPAADAMSPEEARAILGLDAAADSGQIKEAHRHLMLKLHPDQGGSTYLAAKINRAKEILLGE